MGAPDVREGGTLPHHHSLSDPSQSPALGLGLLSKVTRLWQAALKAT